MKNVKEVRMFELVPSLYMRSLFEDLNFELSDFNKATRYDSCYEKRIKNMQQKELSKI